VHVKEHGLYKFVVGDVKKSHTLATSNGSNRNNNNNNPLWHQRYGHANFQYLPYYRNEKWCLDYQMHKKGGKLYLRPV
jgi:hypothetical protein